MSHPVVLSLCLLALAPSTLFASPGQSTLDASKDNTLWNDLAGQTSSGQGGAIYVGRAGANTSFKVRRGLLAFDVASQVPAGATITDVKLRLRMSATVSGSKMIRVHRASSDWGEGASNSLAGAGAQALAGDATWLHTFFSGQFWTTAGGDFNATASATLPVDQPGFYVWQSAQLTADVQAMLDSPATNFGWVLLGNEVQAKAVKGFDSRETATAANAPRLVVDWTIGPVNYCTAGTSTNGCQATLSASGTPSATQATGFVLSAAMVEGSKDGLYFFGVNGRQANSWGNGTSLQCVVPPVMRAGLLTASGTTGQCDGTFAQDLNARWQAKPAQNPGAGALVQAQLWYRDPQNTSNQTTSLSDAIEFAVGP